jgi:hypothetical protein
LSQVKREMERQESMRAEALGIALQAHVLESCPIHEDCVFEGASDIQDAYKLGNWKYSRRETQHFASRPEMTDCIKEVVEEHSGIETCSQCGDAMDE